MSDVRDLEIQRLCNLDDWAYYQVAKHSSEEAICVIGMRYHSELRQVEYEVWGGGDDEIPQTTGTVPYDDTGEQWSDVVLNRALRSIASGDDESSSPENNIIHFQHEG